MVLSEAEGRTLIKTDGFVCLIPGGKCVYTDYTLNHVVIITSPAGERDMGKIILYKTLSATQILCRYPQSAMVQLSKSTHELVPKQRTTDLGSNVSRRPQAYYSFVT